MANPILEVILEENARREYDRREHDNKLTFGRIDKRLREMQTAQREEREDARADDKRDDQQEARWRTAQRNFEERGISDRGRLIDVATESLDEHRDIHAALGTVDRTLDRVAYLITDKLEDIYKRLARDMLREQNKRKHTAIDALNDRLNGGAGANAAGKNGGGGDDPDDEGDSWFDLDFDRKRKRPRGGRGGGRRPGVKARARRMARARMGRGLKSTLGRVGATVAEKFGGAAAAGKAASSAAEVGLKGAARTGIAGASKVAGGLARGIGTKIPLIGLGVTAGFTAYDQSQKTPDQIAQEGGSTVSTMRSLASNSTFGLSDFLIDKFEEMGVNQALQQNKLTAGVMDNVGRAVALAAAPFSEEARDALKNDANSHLYAAQSKMNEYVKHGNEAMESLTLAITPLTKTMSDFTDKISGVLGAGIGAVGEKARKAAGGAADTAASWGQRAADWGAKQGGVLGDAVKAGGEWVVNTAGDASLKVKSGKASDRKDAFVRQLENSGITDPKVKANLMAQVMHETGNFARSEESFAYRPDRLMEKSATARKKGRAAVDAALKAGPQATAELMYGGRMGNKDPGDGYKYRGRGAIQLTGRDTYRRIGKAIGVDLENNPDLMNDPNISAKASIEYAKQNKRYMKAAAAGDLKTARRAINGGDNGEDDVNARYARYTQDLAKNGGDLSKTFGVSKDGKAPTQVAAKKPDAKADTKTAKAAPPPAVQSKPVQVASAKPDTRKPAEAPKKAETVAQAKPVPAATPDPKTADSATLLAASTTPSKYRQPVAENKLYTGKSAAELKAEQGKEPQGTLMERTKAKLAGNAPEAVKVAANQTPQTINTKNDKVAASAKATSVPERDPAEANTFQPQYSFLNKRLREDDEEEANTVTKSGNGATVANASLLAGAPKSAASTDTVTPTLAQVSTSKPASIAPVQPVAASVEREVKPVQVANQINPQQIADAVASGDGGGSVAGNGGGSGPIPTLDDIPLSITELGASFINFGNA